MTCIETLTEHERIRFRKQRQAHLELNLVRDIKTNNKGFYWCISSKGRTKRNLGPTLNRIRGLMTEDLEKSEVLKVFFILVFTSKTDLLESQVPETSVKVKSKDNLPSLWRRIR